MQPALLAHGQINTIATVAIVVAGSTGWYRDPAAFSGLSLCRPAASVSGSVSRAAVQKVTSVHRYKFQQSRLQGTMLWGPVALPEPEASACRLLPESDEKGQQTINHLSEHYLSAALKKTPK